MKLALYVNEAGAVSSVMEPGHIDLYDDESGHWVRVKRIGVAIDDDTTFAQRKQALIAAASQLDGCQVLISSSLKGILYAVLQEELGFRVWKSEGSVAEQLDHVARKEGDRAAEQAAQAIAAATRPPLVVVAGGCGSGGCGSRHPSTRHDRGSIAPVPVGRPDQGIFRIDLAEGLKRNPGLNSRDVLIPILEDGAFHQLEILCDHVPRWFPQRIDILNLTADVEDLDESGRRIKVTVTSRR